MYFYQIQKSHTMTQKSISDQVQSQIVSATSEYLDARGAVNKLLSTFTPLILQIPQFQDNVCIGGTCALVLLGLNVGKLPNDLDIIIYNPTDQQRKFIESLDFFDQVENRPDGLYPDEIKFRKFKKNNMTVDIIFDIKVLGKPNFLKHTHMVNGSDGMPLMEVDYNVSSVSEIIRAKTSYSFVTQSGVKMIRHKDTIDLQNLKALNFNFL